VAGATTQGASHLRDGLPNQDSFRRWVDEANTFVAVSDGHGSARHFRSHVGSRLAVEAADTVFREVLKNSTALHSLECCDSNAVRDLTEHLVHTWQLNVRSDLLRKPFKEWELMKLESDEGRSARGEVQANPLLAYGSTLLAVMATEAVLIYLQLGDGNILNVDARGRTEPALAEDTRLLANRTTSLCLPDAAQQFRYRIENLDHAPALILVSTDGYANSFKTDYDFLKIGADYLRTLKDKGVAALSQNLPAILADASASGSGDDITLGMVISTNAATNEDRVSQREEDFKLELVAADVRNQQLKLNELEERFDTWIHLAKRVALWVAFLVLSAMIGISAFLLERHFRSDNRRLRHEPAEQSVQERNKASGQNSKEAQDAHENATGASKQEETHPGTKKRTNK
jgi:Protein phosphatase 2C